MLENLDSEQLNKSADFSMSSFYQKIQIKENLLHLDKYKEQLFSNNSSYQKSLGQKVYSGNLGNDISIGYGKYL